MGDAVIHDGSDMRFVLNEVFEVSKLWAELPALAEGLVYSLVVVKAGSAGAATALFADDPGETATRSVRLAIR